MYSFRETPRYIQVTGLILAGLTVGIVLGLRGIRAVIGMVVLALPFILALEVLRRRISRK